MNIQVEIRHVLRGEKPALLKALCGVSVRYKDNLDVTLQSFIQALRQVEQAS